MSKFSKMVWYSISYLLGTEKESLSTALQSCQHHPYAAVLRELPLVSVEYMITES